MRDAVKVGDTAPDFELPSQKGDLVRFSEFIGKKTLVLFFYPKDHSPGCTSEACDFRDNYELFQQLGAVVIGVSSDTIYSHRTFSSKHDLPFLLLSDTEEKARKLYGVPSSLGVIPGRVTYVIDTKGTVRYTFSSQFNPKKHIAKAIAALKSIGSQ